MGNTSISPQSTYPITRNRCISLLYNYSIVNLRHSQTIAQFEKNCFKIYKKKIKISQVAEYNKIIIKRLKKTLGFNQTKIKILNAKDNLSKGEEIENFLIALRKDNYLMLNLIDILDKEESNIVVPFLCHFFYENLYNQSTEQQEMLYIIYLLLEKEVDKLKTISIGSFLDESFLSKFLIELGNRYEVKCYLNKILKELIIEIENNYNEYIELDSKAWMKLNPNANANANANDSPFNNTAQKLSEIKEIKEVIGKALTEETMRKAYSNAEGYLKSFLLFQLKKIRKHTNLFSSRTFNEICMLLNRNEFYLSYSNGYKMITTFISKLFANFIDNITIMPYSIKCICKMIKVLISNKFKTISDIELNSFISVFLFEKLIIPVLLNPDINDFGSSTIISIATRRNLLTIEKVLNMLLKGKLFTCGIEQHFTVFNGFIIDNASKINVLMTKITNVSLPSKLSKLASQFYNNTSADDKEYTIDNLKRSNEEINYDYFKENKYDFMQHQSICFQLNLLLILINKVNENNDLFLLSNTEFAESFKGIIEFKKYIEEQMKNQRFEMEFYVIRKDIYKEDVKKLLFTKETKIPLEATIEDDPNVDYSIQLKYCISLLLSRMKFQKESDWVDQTNDTLKTFHLIHHHNDYYDEFHDNLEVPLSWYSLYIIDNLTHLPMKYKENDYKLLCEEILTETNKKIDLLKKMNDFLTIQITPKFTCLDHNVRIAKKEYQMILQTKFNIELTEYIETREFLVCIHDVGYMRKIIGCTKDFIGKYINDCEVRVYHESSCPHRHRFDKKKEIPKENHCRTINDFILRFTSFPAIRKDVLQGTSLSKAKEALYQYRDIIEVLDESSSNSLFKKKDYQKPSTSSCSLQEQVSLFQKGWNEIYNYILKKSHNKLFSSEASANDIKFYDACLKLQWLDPIKNMHIPYEIVNKNLFNKLKEHINRLEYEKTPSDKLNALSKETNLIVSLIKFSTNNNSAAADDILPIIIYSIIISKPKRMISNFQWISIFMNINDSLGNSGYIATQIESSIQFILNIDHTRVNAAKSDFQSQCDKCKQTLHSK